MLIQIDQNLQFHEIIKQGKVYSKMHKNVLIHDSDLNWLLLQNLQT